MAKADTISTIDVYGLVDSIRLALPPRSRATKSLEQLATWVDERFAQDRDNKPFSERNYQLGDVRAAAERELLDTFLAIPRQWAEGPDGIVMTAFGCFLAIVSAPPEVRADAIELLKRERYVPYVNTFVTLRSKGHVSLTRKSIPAKGSLEERLQRAR
jgi:hypothetical protein